MIFAAKTTAAALIALLVSFTFNLDQPQWALLTVFIVAQPQSGMVLAKSFYRIIGTLVGAAVALLFVSLFAQERVLFLGALALWIGLCTFGSQYARNFTAYAFVLSGYTVAVRDCARYRDQPRHHHYRGDQPDRSAKLARHAVAPGDRRESRIVGGLRFGGSRRWQGRITRGEAAEPGDSHREPALVGGLRGPAGS
jgi:uncharacterized membrane protein